MHITVEHHVLAAGPRLSPRAREVAAMFGLTARLAAADEPSRTMTIVPRTAINLPVPGPGIVFITGPSGSGKSTLLALITSECAARGVRVLSMPAAATASAKAGDEGDRAVIDLVAPDRPLAEALELLSLAGLGDAFVMLRRPRELSDGQRLRCHIAQMMAAAARHAGPAAPPTLLAIDEFAATLDRITARTLARNLRRWSDRSGVTIVLATTHDDLIAPLAPDVLIHKPLGPHIEVIASPARLASSPSSSRHPGKAAAEVRKPAQHDDAHDQRQQDDRAHDPHQAGNAACRILSHSRIAHIAAPLSTAEFHVEPGTLDDFRALASFHYRSHHPGAATSVLRTIMQRRDRAQPLLAGVLVRSLPHLNCAARDVAQHHRYATLSQRERGIVLNREIRCISRVVIDPRFRGMGLALRLVRFALEHPENDRLRYTEALAAMGRVSPFFERAGMQRFDLPEACRPAHARLRDALQHLGLTAHDLSRDDAAAARRLPPDQLRWMLAEARRFLRATRRLSSAHLAAMSERDTLAAASERLLLQPVYYVHTHSSINRVTPRTSSPCSSR